jgi:2-polyprenyl-3-methyl-5-hydroxy-6-metoxy-1,4-benzoquinol methylase
MLCAESRTARIYFHRARAGAGCRACGAEATPAVVRRLDRGIAVTRCSACSAAALVPRPTDEALREHYAKYYLTRSTLDSRQERLIEMHGPIVDYLASHVTRKRRCSFFDYGFGSGSFLRQVAARGHEAFGADISSQNVKQLWETCRREGLSIGMVDLSTGNLGQLGRDRFDVITLFQVIEHVPDPLELLRSLSRFQTGGGLLYIECPNDASVLARAKTLVQRLLRRGTMWRSMKYPEHLHGFNRKAMSALLRAAGYEVIDCRDYGYCDGIHQVEGVFWWPPFRENPRWYKPYWFSRSLVQLFDRAMSRSFGAGSGLYALARRVAPYGLRPAVNRCN